ncbi:unnamed protein product [Musa acuminata var. zebrina]
MDGDGRLSWFCRSSPMVCCTRTCAAPLLAAFVGRFCSPVSTSGDVTATDRPGFIFLALLGLDLASDWLQIYRCNLGLANIFLSINLEWNWLIFRTLLPVIYTGLTSCWGTHD